MEELAQGVIDLPEPYGIELLEAVTAAGDNSLMSAISTYPGLVSARVLRRLETLVEQAPLFRRRRLRKTLKALMQAAQLINSYDPRFPYPLGHGPIEQLAADVDTDVIRLSSALIRAEAPSVLVTMTPYYAHALGRQAIEDASHAERWQAGLTLARLTLAAAEAAGAAGERGDARRQAGLDFLLVCGRVLLRFPDGRILEEARSAGECILEEAQAEGDREDVGRASYRIGGLYLDPVMTTGTVDELAVRQALRQRLRDVLGPQIVFEDGDSLDYPRLGAALSEAERRYRLAVETRDGHERGMALKALLQTLSLRRSSGENVDEGEFQRLGQDALALIDADVAPQLRYDVLQMLGTVPDTTTPESVAELRERLGTAAAREAALAQASYLAEHNPGAALALLGDVEQLLPTAPDERSRSSSAVLVRRALVNWGPRQLPQLSDNSIDQLQLRAGEENWEPREHAAALITLAMGSGAGDAEALGLTLWEEATHVSPELFAAFPDALAVSRSILTSDAGSSAWSAGDKVEAARWYADAFAQWYVLGFQERALAMLARLNDTLSDMDLPVAVSILEALHPHLLDLGETTRPAQTPEVQQLLRRVIAVLEKHHVEVDRYLWARQLAKGAMFAALLDSDVSRLYSEAHEEHSSVLDQIGTLEAALGQPELVDNSDVYLDSTLLTAWVTSSEMRGGETAAERLENLRRRFDVLLDRSLVSRRLTAEPVILSDSDIRSTLDRRTVLIDVYLGMDTGGHMTVHNYVATNDRSFIVQIPWVADLADAEVYLGEHGGRQVYTHPLGLWVAKLRDELAGDPGFEGVLTRAAADRLGSAVEGLLGSAMVPILLEEKAAGRDHLCIVPHGPLHYFPYHLIPVAGDTLSELFSVSYLPNLHLLRRRPNRHARQDLRPAVLGMTFSELDPFEIPPLPQSRVEVEAIAEVLGTQAKLDHEVTEAVAGKALGRCSSVHLSTHGVHDLAAPAFQCLLLAPDDDSDGRYTAHEIGQLDLRGLDLVTLSACETALGRFDRGDNLRGLPASLLLTGTSSVVGTLWEVNADAALTFFVTLYRHWADGDETGPAFARAQAATRAMHPTYRDWGAFTLIGDWS